MDHYCVSVLYARRTDLDELCAAFLEYHGRLPQGPPRQERGEEFMGHLGRRPSMFRERWIPQEPVRRHDQGESSPRKDGTEAEDNGRNPRTRVKAAQEEQFEGHCACWWHSHSNSVYVRAYSSPLLCTSVSQPSAAAILYELCCSSHSRRSHLPSITSTICISSHCRRKYYAARRESRRVTNLLR